MQNYQSNMADGLRRDMEYDAILEKQKLDEEERERERKERELQEQQQQQAPQGGGIDPSSAMNAYQQYSGGGASMGGGGGGGGAGMGAGAAGLAAVIVGNELYARNHGYRSEDNKQYLKDVLTTKVLSQDVDERWSPQMFGKTDKSGFGADFKGGASLATFQPKKAWSEFKQGSLAKALRKIF